MKRMDEERQEAERKAAEAREALAKQQAADAEKAKLEAPARRGKSGAAKRRKQSRRRRRSLQQQEAEEAAQPQCSRKPRPKRQQQEAEKAAQLAAQQKAAAEAEAEKAKQAAAQAEAEKAELRKQLLKQLSMVLQTHDTVRGLIVNMSDVLFDTGSYTLKPGSARKACENLRHPARVSLAEDSGGRPHGQRGQRRFQSAAFRAAGGVGARLSG